MTEKLYYKDSHIRSFRAKVLDCREAKARFEIVLDKTAFFPEGGGQAGDSGFIGGVRVFDTHEKDGVVLHYAETAVEIGAELDCGIDWETRFRRMQNHSGEHIVSGLVNSRYGFDNVGFHMGSDFVTIDFDGYLSPEQLDEIEREANLAVAANLEIKSSFPDAESLKKLSYRSKIELEGAVRIVEIEGVDTCACCAPHVHRTAEVGIVKILGSEHRRRGGEGVRITMLCGLDAYEKLAETHKSNAAISVLLSAKREETASAVERLLTEQGRLKEKVSVLSRALAEKLAEATAPTEGNLCLFDNTLDDVALRELVNSLVKKCGGLAAVFSGDDERGYRYIIGSGTINLRKAAGEINSGIGGKGGGSPEMIQGSCREKRDIIQKFIENSGFYTHKI